MPKLFVNWTFKEVERFLKTNGFVLHHTNGSHFYYKGQSHGMIRNVCVPFHGSNEAIKPRTLKGIMLQSGIDKSEWMA